MEELFEYNGKAYDPLKSLRALWRELNGEFSAILKNARSEDNAVAFRAQDQLIPAVREVFGLPEVNNSGEGVSDKSCIQCLKDFVAFLNKKKATTESKQTSPALMESPFFEKDENGNWVSGSTFSAFG